MKRDNDKVPPVLDRVCFMVGLPQNRRCFNNVLLLIDCTFSFAYKASTNDK